MDTLNQIFEQLTVAGYQSIVQNEVCYFKSKNSSDLISHMTLEILYNGLGFPKYFALRVYSTKPWCEEMEQDLLTKSLFYDIQFAKFENVSDLVTIISSLEQTAVRHVSNRVTEYELQKKQLTLFKEMDFYE